MRVKVLEYSLSTSAGQKRQGDIVELPDAEVAKIQKMKPNAFEVLPDEKPVSFKRAAAKKPAKKRARNANGTLKGDDPSTPDVNEAWE